MEIRQEVTITIHSDGVEGIERAGSQYRAADVDWPSAPSRIISRYCLLSCCKLFLSI